MRALLFAGLSALYGVLAFFALLMIALSCGLGPDTSAQCNATVAGKIYAFVAVAMLAYILFAVVFWRKRRKGR